MKRHIYASEYQKQCKIRPGEAELICVVSGHRFIVGIVLVGLFYSFNVFKNLLDVRNACKSMCSHEYFRE